MNADEFKTLRTLPGDPDRSLSGFTERFATRVKRSIVRVSV